MNRAEIYGRTLRHLFAPVARLLYDDETVTEVLINGPAEVYCERGGKLEKTACRFGDEGELLAAVRNLAEYVRRRVDDENHSMDARLPPPERFRVHVILPPASRQGVCVSIRKFRRNTTTLDSLSQSGLLDPAAREYLELMVGTHRNLIVSGGTSSGKTSLLNALSVVIPAHERIIVIEDSSELLLEQPHTVYLEARPPEPDGTCGVTIRDLFVDSLRMRPDRILVGEVRRGEALDLIQSMLSGHDGSLSTVHASSPLLALVRLETLCLLSDAHMQPHVARTQVASAVQVVAQMARFEDGSRRVKAISEVYGLDEKQNYRVRPMFRFASEGVDAKGNIVGRLAATGKRSRYWREVRESAAWAGRVRLTAEIFRAPEPRPGG